MSLPNGFSLKFSRLKNEARNFRMASAGGNLTAEQVQNLGLLIEGLVELVGMLSQCCEEKQSQDIRIKSGNIRQN